MTRRLGMLLVFMSTAGLWTKAQDYSADDFSRLVKKSPLVVAGDIRRAAPEQSNTGGVIVVQAILKNTLRVTGLDPDTEISLAATSNNLFWSKALIQCPEGQVSVWILDATANDGKVEPAEVVAHFTTETSTLAAPPAGAKQTPLEQWGATNAVRQWAVVKVAHATVYTLKGQYAGTLGAGMTLNVLMMTNSASGEVVVGRPDPAIESGPTEIVVLAKEVNVHPGELGQVDAKRKELCIREAVLQSQLRQMWYELADRTREGNPYAAEYRTAKAAYDQYWARVKVLQRQRDTGQGSARMKAADDLRELKGGDIPVGMAFEKARTKYEGWQAGRIRKDMTSPQMEEKKKELARVREELRKLP